MTAARKGLFAILLIAAIGIWTHDALLVINPLQKERNSAEKGIARPAKGQANHAFIYPPDFPDPFYCAEFMQLPQPPQATSQRIKAPRNFVPVSLPQCKIGGIVYNAQKPMAMLLYSGKSILIKPGDVIDSMHIKEIRPDSVRIVYKGKLFSLGR